MAGLIIIVSTIFAGLTIFKVTKIKALKYILSPLISIAYGFLLFFLAMGVSSTLFVMLAVIPVIVGSLLTLRDVLFERRV